MPWEKKGVGKGTGVLEGEGRERGGTREREREVLSPLS